MININIEHSGIPLLLVEEKRDFAYQKFKELWDNSKGLQDIGWVNYPNLISDSELEIIENLAKGIRSNSDVLLVLGTGGSYMGAKALTDILVGDTRTEVVFYGYDFSVRHLNYLLKILEDKDYSICAISKSGGTMEPMAAFSLLMEQLINRYGEDEAASRTYVITEDKKSALHDYAEEIDCHIVHMPKDIGGRYSVFTPVGLLPLAVHGVNIREFVEGARSLASPESLSSPDGTGFNLDYAICRNIYGEMGASLFDGGKEPIPKSIEALEVFDPYAKYLGNWWQQLFGESEGKDGKGIFPTVLLFNRDLHSMGQFLQEGSKTFFETMLFLGHQEPLAEIPESKIVPELSNKKLADISSSVEKGVLEIHKKAGIPLITIGIEEISPRALGELMYYFMIQCAVSALMLGVNPFNQPGVEAYKMEVKKLIREG